MDRVINAPVHRNDVVNGLNATDKRYVREKMEIIGKLARNGISKIGMLNSASREFSVKFAYQCIHIINNK